MLSPFFDFNDRFRWMDSLERRMDRALSQQPREVGGGWMTLRDAGEALVLLADLPGVSDKDVEITIENDVLTLRVDSLGPRPAGYKTVRSERPKIRFVKQIELPVRVDVNAVVATMKDGVLELELPKAADARPRKIAVVGTKHDAKA